MKTKLLSKVLPYFTTIPSVVLSTLLLQLFNFSLSHYCGTIPNDEHIDDEFDYIDNIDLDEAWDVFTGSNSVKVGIIDSGIKSTHEDLYDNVNSTLSTQFGNYYQTGLDDSSGHGTFVSGIVGAVGNNDIGIAGVCWDIDLVSLRVATYSPTVVYIPGLAQAIEYATTNNIPILNISISLTASMFSNYAPNGLIDLFDLNDAISNYPGLIICAAGNASHNIDIFDNQEYPACNSSNNIIVVGNCDENDAKVSDSNYGSTCVDLFAPGENVYSTDLSNDGYVQKHGTSFSAPYVTGVAALLKSIDPTLTTSNLKSAILNNTDYVSGLDGLCVTDGRLNAYNSVLSILPEIVSGNGSTSYSIASNSSRFLKINCSSAGHYMLTTSGISSYKVTIYRKYQSTLSVEETYYDSNSHSTSFLCNLPGLTFIKIDNLSGSDGNINIGVSSSNHSYNNSFSYFNNSYHLAYCECGDFVLLPHIVQVSDPDLSYGQCIKCSANIPLNQKGEGDDSLLIVGLDDNVIDFEKKYANGIIGVADKNVLI